MKRNCSLIKSYFGKRISFLGKCILFLGTFILSVNTTTAQNSISLQHISTQDGLSQSTIYCMLQDSEGFLWFGTRDGLNKFDGYNFTVYRNKKNDSTSISDNHILSIMEDRKGRIWVGTEIGVCVYNKNLNSFHRYEEVNNDSNLFRSSHVYALLQDSRGNIWAGTDGGGVSIYDSISDSFKRLEHFFPTTETTRNLKVRSILELSNKEIWISTIGDGIIIYTPELNTLIPRHRTTSASCGIESTSIRTLYEDSKRNIWIGSDEDGLSVYNLNTKKTRYYSADKKGEISHNAIRSIFEDSHGSIWIATRVGLNQYHPTTNNFTQYFHEELDNTSLSNNSVRSILQDKSGNLWFGTYYGGISVLYNSSKNFRLYKPDKNKANSLNYEIVSSFVENKDGGVWVGTEGGGINYINTTTHEISTKQNIQSILGDEGNNVKALFNDNNNNLWVGTYGNGLYKINLSNNTFEHYTHSSTDSNSISSNNVYVIHIDSKGLCWIGTNLGGLNLFDRKTKTFKHINIADTDSNPIFGNTINCIKEDALGNIWFGSDKGLIKYDGEKYQNITLHNNQGQVLNNVFVLSINIDSFQSLWIGTSQDGLIKLDVNTLKSQQYTINENLSSNIIYGIIEDNASNLWLSTSNGLMKFPLAIQYGKLNKNQSAIIYYNIHDGLQGNEFNRGASFKDSKGNIYFGGLNGFNSFNPKNITLNKTKAPIKLSAFHLSNKKVDTYTKNSPLKQHISQTQSIKLNHKQSSFSFEFVALNYDKPEKNNYAYKLDGFDDDWIYSGGNRTAVYTNIDPGEYKFMVKASNNDNLWNNNGPVVDIIILPPFWKTKLATATYILIVIILLLTFRKLIIIRTNEKNLLEFERLEKGRIEEINQMKLRFFTNISHEFRTPLTLISGPLEKLLNENDVTKDEQTYLLSLMHKNVQRMQRLISQLMDFRKLENKKMRLKISSGNITSCIKDAIQLFEEYCSRKGIALKYISNLSEKEIYWFDKSIVDNVVFILLSNSIKFTPNKGEILVELNQREHLLEVKVKDTGIGIPKDKLNIIFERFYSESNPSKILGTGIGLSFAKNLITLHKGEIQVDSVVDEGTCFTFSFPVNKEAYSDTEITQLHDTLPETDLPSVNTIMPPTTEDSSEKLSESVLIVEDNHELREFIKSSLKKYEIYEAENGKEAFKLAKKHIPDIIISDVMMPIMDGMEFCRLVKNNMITNHIPLILLTAKTKVENRLEGTKSGADVYMDKPFNVALLTANVENLLTQRKTIRERFAGQYISENTEGEINKLEDDFISKAQEIIFNRKSDPDLRVEDLSSELGLSRSQLFRKFKTLTDHSPNEFIKVVRLKYSKELLTKGELNINEISYECGFSSASHFISSFKKHYNKTPKEFALLINQSKNK